MLPPVVVDLGPQASQAELELVLDACNEVIQNGVCLPDSGGSVEAPRATAIARPRDESMLAVRIEVRLRKLERTSWLVRELRFETEDPTAERWRSVGLAIATLVGEGEAAHESEPDAIAPEVAAPPPSASEAAPPPPPIVTEAALPPSEPAASGERSSPPSAGTWSGLFAGVGMLTGPGFDDGHWRLGGSARAGFCAGSGWQLIASVAYSLRGSERAFTASWLSLQAGVGYRVPLSERASVSVSALGGAQQMRFEALANGAASSDARWNPLAALSVDGWWLATSGFGFWASVDAQSIFRETRLLVAPGLQVVTSPPVEASAVLGLGGWLR